MKQEIRHCNGGMIAFGLWGQEASVHTRKFMACNSPYQDALYGPGMRVHNAQGGKNLGEFRCTVCGRGQGVVRP